MKEIAARTKPQPTARMIFWQNNFLIILPTNYSAIKKPSGKKYSKFFNHFAT